MKIEQQLEKRIDVLVQEVLALAQKAASDAVAQAFGTSAVSAPRKKPRGSGGPNRTADEIRVVRERLYEAISEAPGESMMTLTNTLGMRARDLRFPVAQLIRAGQVRTVGNRRNTRYFPMGPA